MSSAVVAFLVGKGSEIGDFLTQHPAVNCISFTGGDTGISVSKKVSCFASSSGSLMSCAHILWGKRSISIQNSLQQAHTMTLYVPVECTKVSKVKVERVRGVWTGADSENSKPTEFSKPAPVQIPATPSVFTSDTLRYSTHETNTGCADQAAWVSTHTQARMHAGTPDRNVLRVCVGAGWHDSHPDGAGWQGRLHSLP